MQSKNPHFLRLSLVASIAVLLLLASPNGSQLFAADSGASGQQFVLMAVTGSATPSAPTATLKPTLTSSPMPSASATSNSTSLPPSPQPTHIPPTATRLPFVPSATPPGGDLARGQYLVTVAACAECHAADSLGGALAGGRPFTLGPLGTFYSANLTMLQGWTQDDFLKVFHQGVDPKTGRVLGPIMPYSAFHGMSDGDVYAIATYLRSLTPVQNDVPAAQPGPLAAIALHPLPPGSVPAPQMSSDATYGSYLVNNVLDCGGCHTPTDATGRPIPGFAFAGGTNNLNTNDAPVYAPAILGSVLTAEGYTEDAFKIALRTGARPRGLVLNPIMPWLHFMYLTDNDLSAVWAYLQTQKLAAPWPVKAVPTAPPLPSGTATMAPTAASQ